MIKKNQPLYTYIFSIIFLLIFVILLFLYLNQKKIVLVHSAIVFNEFAMTKEMKQDGENEIKNRKSQIDSLYKLLQSKEIRIDKNLILNQIIEQKNDLDNFKNNYPKLNSEKIWNRISIYAKEFSKENGYDVLLGSETNSDVIYSDEEMNVTNDFIIYLNNKYEGFN